MVLVWSCLDCSSVTEQAKLQTTGRTTGTYLHPEAARTSLLEHHEFLYICETFDTGISYACSHAVKLVAESCRLLIHTYPPLCGTILWLAASILIRYKQIWRKSPVGSGEHERKASSTSTLKSYTSSDGLAQLILSHRPVRLSEHTLHPDLKSKIAT